MTGLYVRLRNWADNDEGATALEYGILVALIAIIIVGGVTIFGQALDTFFRGIAGKVPL